MSNGVDFRKLALDLRDQFNRVTAERDAALGREAALIDQLEDCIRLSNNRELGRKNSELLVEALQQRLTAADERADVLEGLLRDARHYHGVQLLTDPPKDAWKYHRVSERIDAALNPKPDAAARTWGPYYSTEVITAAVDFKLKPAESGGDDTTIQEEREDAKKVFVRTNTKQGQNVSLADMQARYEPNP